MNRHLPWLFLLFLWVMHLNFVFAQEVPINKQKHIEVSLRYIGHHILLAHGDSKSRVLPVEFNHLNGSYTLRFEANFGFHPEALVELIDTSFKQHDIDPNYLVEVRRCGSDQTVYSFEKGKSTDENIIPCKGRYQPEGCFYLQFHWYVQPKTDLPTDADSSQSDMELVADVEKANTANTGNLRIFAALLIALVLVLSVLAYRRFRTSNPLTEQNKMDPGEKLIHIGKYQFNPVSMELLIDNSKTELTGKEAELLELFYSNINQTLERDVILQKVWQDEGDYIGRTLDVFISKLRKKLDQDPAIKIMNIRGIGYKFIVNQA